MAMRMKYKDKIDATTNHWNTSPGETSPALNRRRFTDFQEYMVECKDLNEKSESDVEASHTQKQSGEEEEEEKDEEDQEEEGKDQKAKTKMISDCLCCVGRSPTSTITVLPCTSNNHP